MTVNIQIQLDPDECMAIISEGNMQIEELNRIIGELDFELHGDWFNFYGLFNEQSVEERSRLLDLLGEKEANLAAIKEAMARCRESALQLKRAIEGPN